MSILEWHLRSWLATMLFRIARWTWPSNVQEVARERIGAALFTKISAPAGEYVVLYTDVGGSALPLEDAAKFARDILEMAEA